MKEEKELEKNGEISARILNGIRYSLGCEETPKSKD
jgi:hypothetical protein